jgi:Ca2+:H+ antiporter
MLKKAVYLLLIFIPLAFLAEWTHAAPLARFAVAALGIIPLAGLIGTATEHLAKRTGAGVGSFLNATFGNAAELIICFFALRAGLHEVVKASITGAIIGNLLLVLGAAFLVGGFNREKQTFNRTAAGLSSTLLLLSAIALVIPALFHSVTGGVAAISEHELSLTIAVVLFFVYLLSLLFSFKTHRHLYAGELNAKAGKDTWSVGLAVGVLLATAIGLGFMSEFLVAAIEPAAKAAGMNQIFVGVILVAIIGNAVEHFSAISFAVKDQMDVTLGIALGGSQQMALFVAPVLVFASYLTAKPMDLNFNLFEVGAVMMSVLTINFVAADGESHWMEGVLLVGVYLILAIAFYFLR